jgi:hypothetical protein
MDPSSDYCCGAFADLAVLQASSKLALPHPIVLAATTELQIGPLKRRGANGVRRKCLVAVRIEH